MVPVNNRPFRIGLLSVYFGLFDEAMPPSFRHDREAYAARVATILGEYGEVIFRGVVDTEESGAAAGAAFAEAGVDVVVFAPSMAAPPSYAAAAVAAVPEVPIIAVGAQESASVPDDYATEEATRRSLPVGLVMFTNVLVRQGRRFTTVIGYLDDGHFRERLSAALAGIRGARAVRRARVAAFGAPIGGYTDVEVSDVELSRLGVERVDVTREELNAAFHGVATEAVDAFVAKARARFDATAVPEDVLARSARLGIALERLCDEFGVAGGTVNCHGDMLRFNEDVGITACLGMACLTEAGRPFSCTGDIPTALALILGKAIAGSALYCELYQLDFPGDWLLVANGGEGDLEARAPTSTVRLLPEDHYLGRRGPGTAVMFPLARGPVTLVSFTPAESAVGGWVLIAAEGQILDSRHETMEGPNGMFRFGSGPVAEGYRRWCEAGATHHAGVLPGHRGTALAQATAELGIQFAAV